MPGFFTDIRLSRNSWNIEHILRDQGRFLVAASDDSSSELGHQRFTVFGQLNFGFLKILPLHSRDGRLLLKRV